MKLRAETNIQCNRDTIWALTQDPKQHARWDLRFTDIEYLPRNHADAPQQFRYATRIGFGLSIQGWGETLGSPDHSTSALRFGSDDPKSLIRKGAGSWTYKPVPGGIHFRTVYDYSVRYGRAGLLLDRLVLRPMMVWATRWSFDRLRLWIEGKQDPELSLRLWAAKMAGRFALGFVWIYEGLMPKLLFVSPGEMDLVGQSGLYWTTPRAALGLLGLCEMLLGIWLLSGKAERAAVTATTAAMLVLTLLACWVRPGTLVDPFGGVSKNLGLIACALVMWLLAPITPRAYPVSDKAKEAIP